MKLMQRNAISLGANQAFQACFRVRFEFLFRAEHAIDQDRRGPRL